MADLSPELLLDDVLQDAYGGDDPVVRSLVEGRVAELLASQLYARHGDRLSM
jgi:hypothetical protein